MTSIDIGHSPVGPCVCQITELGVAVMIAEFIIVLSEANTLQVWRRRIFLFGVVIATLSVGGSALPV